MAYPHRRADSGDALASSHRPVFFHHARSALVCLGMVVRHTARDSAPRLRTEWSGLAVRSAGGRDFRDAAFAIAAARDRPAAGDRADAAGGGGLDDSSLRAPAHCELAFFSALVCCAGKMGALGRLRARGHAADWIRWFFPASMLLWVNLHGGWLFGIALLGIYTFAAFVESLARARCVGRDSRRASGSLPWLWLGWPRRWRRWRIRMAGGCTRTSIAILGDRYLMNRIDEFRSPDFHGWAPALVCDHPGAGADRVLRAIVLRKSSVKNRQASAQSAAGRAAGGLCGILFVAQSSGFVDAAGAGGGADPVGKLRFAGG